MSKTKLEQIGDNVRRNRERPPFISQEALASEAGLTRTSIRSIEAGKQNLPILKLLAISEALGVHIMELLP